MRLIYLQASSAMERSREDPIVSIRLRSLRWIICVILWVYGLLGSTYGSSIIPTFCLRSKILKSNEMEKEKTNWSYL